MLYLYLDSNSIRLLYLRKSILGQYETSFHKKSFPANIVEHGTPYDSDALSLEIKDILSNVSNGNGNGKEKDVVLILPQNSFEHMQLEIPEDVSGEAVSQYVFSQARIKFQIDTTSSYGDFLLHTIDKKRKASFYAITNETMKIYKKTLALCGLELSSIIPDTLAYFTLFEKTLRKNKNETIWYVRYDSERVSSYLFDSFGLISNSYWSEPMTPERILEKVLQKKSAEYSNSGLKLNRLIISGKSSESVRQDTFTKSVGVWTNPIKKIIPNFYADYLKMLSPQTEKVEIPILSFDMVLGAFIFLAENKQFSLSNKAISTNEKPPFKKNFELPKLKMSFQIKTVVFFILSSIVTYLALVGAANLKIGESVTGFAKNISNISLPSFSASPTPEPSPTLAPPTPTPTPAIDKATVRIQILNGSGVRGKATAVKNFMRDKGYEEILTGNAERFNYETTVIQTKEGSDRLRDLIAEDIASELLEKPIFETLDEDSASDVVLIFGQDFR